MLNLNGKGHQTGCVNLYIFCRILRSRCSTIIHRNHTQNNKQFFFFNHLKPQQKCFQVTWVDWKQNYTHLCRNSLMTLYHLIKIYHYLLSIVRVCNDWQLFGKGSSNCSDALYITVFVLFITTTIFMYYCL